MILTSQGRGILDDFSYIIILITGQDPMDMCLHSMTITKWKYLEKLEEMACYDLMHIHFLEYSLYFLTLSIPQFLIIHQILNI